MMVILWIVKCAPATLRGAVSGVWLLEIARRGLCRTYGKRDARADWEQLVVTGIGTARKWRLIGPGVIQRCEAAPSRPAETNPHPFRKRPRLTLGLDSLPQTPLALIACHNGRDKNKKFMCW